MPVMSEPRQESRQVAHVYELAKLRAELTRIRNVLPAIEGLLDQVEKEYGPSVEGMLGGLSRAWTGVRAARTGLQDLMDAAPAKPAKKRG